MRGIVVLFIILGSIPYCLNQPWIGVLVFNWISYMNPHRYAWGPAREFPVGMVVAIATLIGLTVTRDKNRVPLDTITIFMLLLWILFCLTTPFAINQEYAWRHLTETSKIFLMITVSTMVINDARKLRYLLLVIALSLGLIGVKGAVFAIATGGAHRVYGPDGSFLSDNNDIALAFNMTLPLMLYLSKDEKNYWLKLALKISFVMTIIAIIFTYSRGGFLALAFVSFLLLVKARYKSIAIMLLGIGVLLGTLLIPSQWSDRMNTIQTYEQDNSAMGRLNAWRTAWNLALDRPLTGGGFNTFTPEVFAKYAPDPTDIRDVHSNYFEMLGEQGFIGLFLYVALIGTCLLTLSMLKFRVRRNFARIAWAQYYPDMLQVSIFAYLVGGAFLGRAYFDLFYQLIASIVILKRLVLQQTANAPAVAAKPLKSVAIPTTFRPISLRS